ncbi:anti-sigma factor antagonist [Anaerotignum lactatifermentans]|uniref:Anti-sigma factor antagonist n=1 Tax=Anaerotignum lactatifermentans TaxID=160404 RepID=A0ABS2GAM6_9FIRM|nr:anti-sigma factor antagonist [Anaerotignum lactatifermentans]MBM6828398.1 anti-sigma factor antagonist [Anaerotignum lactatifermentans]MBM6877678.1 anti-sigma factor antagonist [Anaerotignum lactatifermentans]MBM6949981.1 anti-sigma factor antagonist [Anaerotignum lactatifermentans]
MEVSYEKKENILVVSVKGEIDHHTSTLLRERTDEQLDKICGKHLLFCFQEVTFMDSAGIGVLLGRFKRVQGLGGRMAIACAGERVGMILKMSALTSLIPLFSSQEEAISYLKGGRGK